MKIAMIGHKRIPSREGGVEIVVEELSTRMAKLGHRVTVYNRAGSHVSGDQHGEITNVKEYRGVRLINVPTPSHRAMNAMVYSLFATIHALLSDYDVIHYHAEGPSAMLFLTKLFRKKTVATVHGLDWQRSKWGGFATKYLLFGEKMIVKYADEVIVLSENVQSYFHEEYGRETSFIPNAVNKPTIQQAAVIQEKYGLAKDTYILFLARLVPEKGLHYLLEAFRSVETDMRLVVAGGSSHTDEYVKEIERQAAEDKRVILTGFVQGAELEELYANCFLYVLPSDVEGMPLTLLEAMSYGCRCLTSDIPENVSVTGAYAHAFKKADIADLRDKLNEACSGKLSYAPASDIAANVLSRYHWDDIVEQTLALYVSINPVRFLADV